MTRPDPSLQQQAGIRTALRVGGLVLLAVGGLLTLGGMVSFFSAFGTGAMPTNFWMAFVGLPMVAAGVALTRAGFLGPASRYVAGEVTPTIADALGALGVGNRVACASCGADNDADARFCDSCGQPLNRTCASCGATNDPDAQFCDSCGQPLPA
jgi:hypothetical protein